MKLIVLDPSLFDKRTLRRNGLGGSQDVKKKLDIALANAGVSSIIAGSNT